MKIKRQKIVFIFVDAALFVILVTVLFWPSREPIYQGRRLSRWTEDFGRGHRNNPPYRQAVKAIREFGTNGVPYYLKWINYQPPRPWGIAIDKLPVISDRIEGKNFRALGAREAFHLLWTNAAFAIEDLNRMAANAKSNQVQHPVVALTYLGEKALPAMIAALTNRNLNCRPVITDALCGHGTNARAALPALLQCISDPDDAVRAAACDALRRMRLEPIRLDPAQVVPALMQAMSDPSPKARHQAVIALQGYGTNSRPAVAILLKALTDPDPNVRASSRLALHSIAPDALPQANPP